MLKCLNLDPESRPTAASLCTELNIHVTWAPPENKEEFEHNMDQLDDLNNVVINLTGLDRFNGPLLFKDRSNTCCDDDYNGLQPFLE